MSAVAPSDNLLTEWSRLLFARLAAAGVREVVVSPGSRSTPFTWAALHTPELACHSVQDERAAAFYALGMARISGRPSLLLCTSGSAPAHYFPAVVEASLARVPLLIVTADRPFELQDVNAAQTVDQTKLYGDFARRFYELGAPDPSPAALSGAARLAEQAVFHARYPDPGPVHLNVRARKPLEPVTAENALRAMVDALLAEPARLAPPPEVRAAVVAIAELAERCRSLQRGLLVAGPAAPGELAALPRLAEATGFPLLCEATSQLRFAGGPRGDHLIDAFEPLLRSREQRSRLAPELVIHFGPPATSSGLEALLASGGIELHVIARHGFPDPGSRARSVTVGALSDVAERLIAAGGYDGAARREFRTRWASANQAAWRALERVGAASAGFCEGAAVRAAVESLPRGSLLSLGNSLPVRDVDLFVPAADRGISVLHQRGANGIDGLLSGAAGAGHAFPGPTLLLVGDVAFLHDLGGLELVRRAEKPLVVLVVDNGGGRIFEQLPLAPHFAGDPALSKFWLTPPGVDFEHAARAFGIPYAAPTTATELAATLQGALERRGATLVHARVVPDSAARDLAAVVAALEAEAGP